VTIEIAAMMGLVNAGQSEARRSYIDGPWTEAGADPYFRGALDKAFILSLLARVFGKDCSKRRRRQVTGNT
jgi:hypothetical protein